MNDYLSPLNYVSVYKGPLVVLYDIEGTLVALYEYKGTPCVQQKIKSIKHHLTTRGLEH